MELKWKLHTYTFKPDAYNADEVREIMSVHRGTWVKAVAVRIGEVFNGTTPTISIGDDVAGGGDIDGFATTAQVICEVLGLKVGYGVYFTGTNGKLYTGDDTIDIDFVHASGSTGLATVYILYAETE